jgi:hypothetical protein
VRFSAKLLRSYQKWRQRLRLKKQKQFYANNSVAKMLAGFCALNESSNAEFDSESSQDVEKTEESLDFKDDDYLQLYNTALTTFGEW